MTLQTIAFAAVSVMPPLGGANDSAPIKLVSGG